MANSSPKAQFSKLTEHFRQYEKLAVAFSGGVDSTLTLHAAMTALGIKRVIAFYALSTLNSASAIAVARTTFTTNFPASAVLREIAVAPLLWPEFVINTEDRCYLCKKRMYTLLGEAMAAEGFSILADGTNADDLQEQRPGLKAIRELQVKTPLAEVGLTKSEIRFIARNEGLSNFDLPSNSCLATRIEPGSTITEEGLRIIENAENFLHDRGFVGCRVRPRKDFILVEVQEKDLAAFIENGNREEVRAYFKRLQEGTVMLNLAGR